MAERSIPITLETLDGGNAAAALQEALTQMAMDMEERSGITTQRTVTLKIKGRPTFEEDIFGQRIVKPRLSYSTQIALPPREYTGETKARISEGLLVLDTEEEQPDMFREPRGE